jgi:ribosomal protein S20
MVRLSVFRKRSEFYFALAALLTISRFDSAVSKGVLKKQTAARKKSRIMALVNKAAK